MKKSFTYFILTFCLINAFAELPAGKGEFVFDDSGSGQKKNITVYYYMPQKLTDSTKAVIIIHGNMRRGEVYRDLWSRWAQRYNMLIISPSLNETDFPGYYGFQMGNVIDVKGKRIEKIHWGFSVIERLFDYIKKESGLTAETYCIYGHSAGAQFVHRMLIFMPEARISRAIAAAAGCYTVPDPNVNLVYGLKNSIVNDEMLKQAFSKELFLLLADKDREYVGGDALELQQGKNRWEKGQYFFNVSSKKAQQLGAEFRWRKLRVMNADHASDLLDEKAAELFYRTPRGIPGKVASAKPASLN